MKITYFIKLFFFLLLFSLLSSELQSIALSGIHLSRAEIDLFNKGTLLPYTKQLLIDINKIPFKTIFDQKKIIQIKEKIQFYESLKQYLFWYYKIPTIGILLADPFWPIRYPFLPHMFPLWQMAPTLGKNIKIAAIDTGITVLSLKDNSKLIYHPDLRIVFSDYLHKNYNFAKSRRSDGFEDLVEIVRSSLKTTEILSNLSYQVASLMYQYLSNNNDASCIDEYLKKYGKKDLINSQGIYNEEGKRIRRAILSRIHPQNKKPSYTLISLPDPFKKKVFLEFLPNNFINLHDSLHPIHKGQTRINISNHGNHIAGTIAAKIVQPLLHFQPQKFGVFGIAPQSDFFMIKAFNEHGETSRKALIASLQRALADQVDLINMSLKISDSIDPTEPEILLFKNLCKKVPYTIAAAGNECNHMVPLLSYPAKFDTVTSSVGAFGFLYDEKTDEYKCPIISYSQFQPGIGPEYVAPGQHILGCSISYQTENEPDYTFMDGTSTAAPFITGFYALMLGEFKNEFSKEQMLAVCRASCIRMHTTKEWKEHALYGTIDMRTALFILHVLRSWKHAHKDFIFTYQFDFFVKKIHELLLKPVHIFSKKYLNDVRFEQDYMTFFNAVQKIPLQKISMPNDFESAIVSIREQLETDKELKVFMQKR